MFPARLASQFAVLLAIASLTPGCKPAQTKLTEPPSPSVSVAQPIARSIHDHSDFTGRTEAIDSVEVRARVSGYLDKAFNTSTITPEPRPGDPPPAEGAARPEARRILEGEEVQKGEILFRIDKRPYQAEYDRLGATIDRDEALVKRTEADYRRSADLFRRNVLSREDFDKSEASYKEAKASVVADRASLERARLDLEFCDVTAPIAGRIGRAQITEGNLITAGPTGSPTLTTIVSQDPIFVSFRVDERSLLRFIRRRLRDEALSAEALRDAKIPVDLSLSDEGDSYPYHGILDFADNQVDPSTGTINVRGRFDNKDNRLTPGLFARVRISSPEPHDALLVPERAIQSDQNKKYVWVVGLDGSVKRRDVTLSDQPGSLREVTRGLELGDQIIISGMQRARDGLKVVAEPASFNDAGNVITGAGPGAVAPVTIAVTAHYPGADKQTVARTVTNPIETEVLGVENVVGTSSRYGDDGRIDMTVVFAPGTDPDKAQVLVQNCVANALPELPDEVRRQGVTTQKKSSPVRD